MCLEYCSNYISDQWEFVFAETNKLMEKIMVMPSNLAPYVNITHHWEVESVHLHWKHYVARSITRGGQVLREYEKLTLASR